MKYIYLVVGKSGSGKNTLVKFFCDNHNCKEVISYTTRARRYNGEDTHIFITDNEFDKLNDLCAYTKFSHSRYGATSQQVDESDFYIIDPNGISYFYDHYTGQKEPVVIYIECSAIRRFFRMLKRKDKLPKIFERLINDKKEFKDFEKKADYVVKNNNKRKAIRDLKNLIFWTKK